MNKVNALCYTAHDGKGAPYICVHADDAINLGLNKSMNWSRRKADSLPGLSGDTLGMTGELYYVANARKIGLIDSQYWSVKYGPAAFNAEYGIPVWLEVEL